MKEHVIASADAVKKVELAQDADGYVRLTAVLNTLQKLPKHTQPLFRCHQYNKNLAAVVLCG